MDINDALDYLNNGEIEKGKKLLEEFRKENPKDEIVLYNLGMAYSETGEYECYGENKLKSIEKFRYLNGHIIPQLMRFASSFSIVTDREIRRRTIEDWNNKIIELVYNDENIKQRITEWMDTLYHRNMPETVFRDFEKCLVESFQNNIRIMLVIDEFTSEQKDTLTNIINSFRMENDTGVGFVGYIVRLHQKIDIFSPEEEFALSIE